MNSWDDDEFDEEEEEDKAESEEEQQDEEEDDDDDDEREQPSRARVVGDHVVTAEGREVLKGLPRKLSTITPTISISDPI